MINFFNRIRIFPLFSIFIWILICFDFFIFSCPAILTVTFYSFRNKHFFSAGFQGNKYLCIPTTKMAKCVEQNSLSFAKHSQFTFSWWRYFSAFFHSSRKIQSTWSICFHYYCRNNKWKRIWIHFCKGKHVRKFFFRLSDLNDLITDFTHRFTIQQYIFIIILALVKFWDCK